MVECGDHGKSILQAVARPEVHRRRDRLDPQFVEQSEQKGGLGLAVAVPSPPGFVGGRRRQGTFAHHQGDVTDLVLNQSKGRRRLDQRVVG
ncbi:hypothetical protein D3C86_1332760 [compost metagenome]